MAGRQIKNFRISVDYWSAPYEELKLEVGEGGMCWHSRETFVQLYWVGCVWPAQLFSL